MNLHDSYYERIIYKKGAVNDLSSILNENFKHKKVFFLSGKSAYQKFGTSVVNQLNRAGSEFIFKFIDSTTNKKNLEDLVGEILTCKVIVALGGGSVADSAKYLAKVAGLKYILIPTSPTTTAYFSDYAFLQGEFLSEEIKCEYSFKILIDENFISKSIKEQIHAGKQFLSCLWEIMLNIEINNLLFEKKQNAENLRLLIAKIKDNIEEIDSSNDASLILMDLLIDAGFVLKDLDLSYQSSTQLAMLLKTSGAISVNSFGAICLTSTKMLFESYKKFFELKKIDVYSFLDLESLACNLTFLKVDAQIVKIQNIKSIRQNKQLFLKLNAVKNQILCLLDAYLQDINVLSIKKEKAKVDLTKCMMSFNILPYVYNCSPLTNILSSTGLITCWKFGYN